MDNRDLNFELDNLKSLLKMRMEGLKTDAERAAATPAIVALTHEISSLIKTQAQLGIEAGETLERATLEVFMSELLKIILEEINKIPSYTNLSKLVGDVTGSAEAAGAVREFISDYPDRNDVCEAIARRVVELGESLKNETSNRPE